MISLLVFVVVVFLSGSQLGHSAKCGGHDSRLLPETYIPQHYDIELIPQIESDDYFGHISLTLQPNNPEQLTDVIVLHSDHIKKIEQISITINGDNDGASSSEQATKKQLIPHSEVCFDDDLELLVIKFDSLSAKLSQLPNKSRSFTLDIIFEKHLRYDFQGLHSNHADDTTSLDQRYLYTGFGRDKTRLVFPCFDEPRFLATIRLKLNVPLHQIAVSVSDIESVRILDNSIKRITFATSELMAMQQLAFAIFLNGKKQVAMSNRDGLVFITTWIPPYQIENRHIFENMSKILRKLYGKFLFWPSRQYLSIVALDGLKSHEAYGKGLVICDSDLFKRWDKDMRVVDLVQWETKILYQLAHYWLRGEILRGSAADLWLFESLTKWISIEGRFYEQIRFEQGDLSDALYYDSQPSAKPILPPNLVDMDYLKLDEPTQMHPLDEHPDVELDHVSLTKSLGLLITLQNNCRMLHFKEASLRRIKDFRNRVFRTSDFVRSLKQDCNILESAEFIHMFITKPGYPMLSVDLETPNRMLLTQERFFSDYYSQIDWPDKSLWLLPITIQTYVTSLDLATVHSTTLAPVNEVVAVNLDPNNLWVGINQRRRGYFRIHYSDRILVMLSVILSDSRFIRVSEQIGAIQDAKAFVEASRVGPSYLIKVLVTLKTRKLSGSTIHESKDIVETGKYEAYMYLKRQLAGTKYEPAIDRLAEIIFANLYHFHRSTVESTLSDENIQGRASIYALLANIDHATMIHDIGVLGGLPHHYNRATFIVTARTGSNDQFITLMKLYQSEYSNNLREDICKAVAHSNSKERLNFAFDILSKHKDQVSMFLNEALFNIEGRDFVQEKLNNEPKMLNSLIGQDNLYKLAKEFCTIAIVPKECSLTGPLAGVFGEELLARLSAEVQIINERRYFVLMNDEPELDKLLFESGPNFDIFAQFASTSEPKLE